MSEHIFKLPDLGEGTVEAEIVEWHVKPGDLVAEGDVVVNDAVQIRLMMNLSASFDHRFVDGFDAASFIAEMKRMLEEPATLFLDA